MIRHESPLTLPCNLILNFVISTTRLDFPPRMLRPATAAACTATGAVAGGYAVHRSSGAASVRVTMAPDSPLHAVVARSPSLRAYFATPWLPGPHLNTVFASVFRRAPASISFNRSWLALADGGIVTLDWSCMPRYGQPVVLVLHGLTGGSHERYVQWLVHTISVRLGLCCAVLNARGCSETELASPMSFSAAFTDDIRAAVAAVRAAIGPRTPIFAAGFSLGAGILLKFLAEEGPASDVSAAVALSASYDYVANSRLFEEWPARVTYNRVLAYHLVTFFRRHRHHFRASAPGPTVDWSTVRRARTVRDFDEAVIVPLFGYTSSTDYYTDASVGPRLGQIRVPTLLLNAADDPICFTRFLPHEAVLSNPMLVSAVTSEGGHVAWSTGWMPTGSSWDNDATAEWFDAILRVPFAGGSQAAGESAMIAQPSTAAQPTRIQWEAAESCDFSRSPLRFTPYPDKTDAVASIQVQVVPSPRL